MFDMETRPLSFIIICMICRIYVEYRIYRIYSIRPTIPGGGGGSVCRRRVSSSCVMCRVSCVVVYRGVARFFTTAFGLCCTSYIPV